MSGTGFVVREAREAELAAAGAVVVDAYRALGDPGHDDYHERIRDTASRARVCPILVAVEDDGTVLGCVTYVPGPGNPYAEAEVGAEAGFRMLGVAPDAQGRGIGRALVGACIARARGEGRTGLAIATGSSMHAAHRLYASMGFRRAPERDFTPVPGVDLMVYVLAL